VLAEPASQSPMFETVHLHTLLLWVFLMFATALFSADSPQGIWRGIGRDIAVVAALALLLIAFWAFLGQFPGQNWKWAWHSGITILAGAGLASYYGARRVDRLVNAVEIAQRGERQEKRFREATYAFLRNTSHEMRAPLNTIVLSADLLLRRPLDEPVMKSVRNIRSFAWDLAYLTDDLLDSAKRRAGKLKVERQEFDIDGCVERVKQWAEPYAKRFKFEVEFKLQSPLGAMISDEGRLRQIIRNMISNACKFGGAGRNPVVEIARELVDGREHLTCRVRDFGKGMDEDFRSRLFVEFEQADGSNARERDGAGLGLSISLSLAQLMGGSLECEWSEPGKGSIFCARIPVTPGVEPSSGD
jgi:signal transduction histidine kinase